MKTTNHIFTAVILQNDVITTGIHFDFQEAKEIVVNTLKDNFNFQQDEGLIFQSDQPGMSEAIFNYRAYVNGEEDLHQETAKENRHVKVFFACPSCGNKEGKLLTDEDGDVVMECKKTACGHRVLVK